jgi:hypothetical protein
MAAALGSLVVSLGLDAAQFTAGLNKAEFEAQRATQKLKKDLDSIGVAFGIAAAAAGAFAVKMGADFISAAANLDDMAEKTGASVEGLSKLSQQAHISGTSLESIETTLIQLSKHLQGAGEESKNTERALAALGLKASELKNLDTAEALQRIAVELNKFSDGMGKGALATDLLGKAGAQALPFLKDLANDAQLAANVTKEQAAQAEELGQAWRRLTLDAKNVGQAIALDMIPWLKDMIQQFAAGIKIAGSFGEALRLFGLSTITQGSAGSKIASINKELEELAGKLSDKRFASPNWQSSINKQMDDLKKQLEFAKVLQRQTVDMTAGDTPGEMQRFGLSGAKRTLDYKALPPPPKAPASAGIDKAAQAAERYREMLISLESQLRAVNGEETQLQKIRERMAGDKDFALIPAGQREALQSSIEMVAAQIDMAKEQKEVNKGWVAYIEALQAADEATLTFNASLVKSPKELQELADSVKSAIDPAFRLQKQMEALKDVIKQGFITEADAWKSLLPDPVYLDDTKHKLDEITDASRDMGHAIGTAFEDAILEGKKFGDILKALGQDIARILLRQSVTKPLENAIGSSGGFFSNILDGLFGRSTAGMAFAAGNDGNIEGAKLGSFSVGSSYVPRTGMYELHQGESVWSAARTSLGQNASTIDARTYVDARGATQEAIPGIVSALQSHERALQRLQSGDGYRRFDQTRRAMKR